MQPARREHHHKNNDNNTYFHKPMIMEMESNNNNETTDATVTSRQGQSTTVSSENSNDENHHQQLPTHMNKPFPQDNNTSSLSFTTEDEDDDFGLVDVDMTKSSNDNANDNNIHNRVIGVQEPQNDQFPMRKQNSSPPPPAPPSPLQIPPSPQSLTNIDLSTIQHLDDLYDQALIEREIGWNARYISVRQNAGLSLWFMLLYLTIGTIFFHFKTEWSLLESLLFSIYTITTVGYGRHTIPNKNDVLLFISFYIFLGIATLTIMAAQLYQWLVLEITWARYEHDKLELNKRHEKNVQAVGEMDGVVVNGSGNIMNPNNDNYYNNSGHHLGQPPMLDLTENGEVRVRKSCVASILDSAVVYVNKVQDFVKEYPSGQLIVVMMPFSFLILLGAIIIGSIEGWNIVESIYFSVVSLTTVGYGDYYPDKAASQWFCIVWLPFSVFFVSLYLGSIASFYIKMSEINISRIERKLRKRMNRVRSWQEKEREEARIRASSAGFGVAFDEESDEMQMNKSIPSHISSDMKKVNKKKGFASVSLEEEDGSATSASPARSKSMDRRNQILENVGLNLVVDRDGNEIRQSSEMMNTTADVIDAIKSNMSSSRRFTPDDSDMMKNFDRSSNNFLTIQSTVHYNTEKGIARKPSFALRVLVQERLARIIAHEVAGYQSNVTIKNNTLTVTIDSLKHTCEKWFIPKRATKTFRSVAFETLYFIGERQLIVRGAHAVFELRPAEVQGLFGPVLASMGDADTMEAWLHRTQTLANSELKDNVSVTDMKLNLIDDRHVNQISKNLTSDPNHKRNVIGNAVNNNTN